MLVVPFGRRRLLGVVVGLAEESELAGGAPGRAAARRSRPRCRPSWCGSASGWPRSTAPPRRAGSRWCCRRAPARAAAARCGRAARCACELTEPGGGAAPRRRPARGAPARRAARRWRDGPLGAAALGRAAGCDHATLRRLERRGLVALEQAARRRAGGRGSTRRGRPRAARAGAHARAAAPRSTRSSRAHRAPAEPAACCSTASPAAARPRSTCARWRRRWSAGARRSCSCPRSRSRRRRRAASWSASATRWPCMHSQLAPRERYDEWCAHARAARRACASARARRCSPRSPTSA